MSLRFFALKGLLVLLAGPLLAAEVKLDHLAVLSKTYSNVTVLGYNATDVFFTHAQGISNAKLKYLEPALQERFNYDPKAAAAAEQKQSEDAVRYRAAAAANIEAQATKAIAAVKKAAATSEESLADPISDESLIGKRGPALEVEKWLGDKPALDGKFVMVSFWAPWSIPCRKAIPDLNALQKKFSDKLAIVALTSESEAEVQAMAGPKMEFASAIDTKATMSLAAGVPSLPYVLLLDPLRIVRYQGHPGALNEKNLQALLLRPAE